MEKSSLWFEPATLSMDTLAAGLEGPPFSWFALRTKSNYERQCATSLSHKGFETLLPTYRCRRQRWDRTVELDLPLFPGYLFCRFDHHHPLPILMSPGIVHIVGGGGSAPEAVPEKEIATVRAIVEAHLRSEPWPFLEIGQDVKIVSGPLTGVEGILVSSKGKHRLVVSVTLLQRSVATEVDATWVRPLTRSVSVSAPARIAAGATL